MCLHMNSVTFNILKLILHVNNKILSQNYNILSFSRLDSLQKHNRHIHSDSRPYHCPYCGNTYKTNSNLNVHLRIHTGVKLYSCRHCSERFTWRSQLKQHLLKSHNEGIWSLCNICEYRFVTFGICKAMSLIYSYSFINTWQNASIQLRYN